MKLPAYKALSGRDAAIDNVIEVVGGQPAGETVMVEVLTPDRCAEIFKRLCKIYPYSEFMMESFTTNGELWAYIYIQKTLNRTSK